MNQIQLHIQRYDYEMIKNLGFVYAFSNTEKNDTGCKRFYGYEYIQNYSTKPFNKNICYGVIWHQVVEVILLDSKKDYNDKPLILEKCLNILKINFDNFFNKYLKELDKNSLNYIDLYEEKISIFNRINLSLEGWVLNWNEQIWPHYIVIDVEKELYAPCIFEEQIYSGNVPIIEYHYEDFIKYQVCRIGEKTQQYHVPKDCLNCKISYMEMPFYKIGKADVILKKRDSDALWILDHKTTTSVSSYESKIFYDLQLRGYCRLLDWQIKNGVAYTKDNWVGGIIYDLCSSKISSEPKPLKSGKMSIKKTGMPPSWLFKKAAKKHNINLSEYSEYLSQLKFNDKKFFKTIELMVSKEEIERCAAEDFSSAKYINQLQIDAFSINLQKKYDIDVKLPRYPLCTQYGSCKYSNKCFANSQIHVNTIAQSTKIKWIENR